MRKHIGAWLLALGLLLALLPAGALAVKNAMQLNTSVIANPQDEGTTVYNYVYYGMDGATPLKWRVLDTYNMDFYGMLLLSDNYLTTERYPFRETQLDEYLQPSETDGNVYQISDVRKILETNEDSLRKTMFSDIEQEAMRAIYKSDDAYTTRYAARDSFSLSASDAILNGDKLFLLSAEEAENDAYFPRGNADRGGLTGEFEEEWSWLLRSPVSGTGNTVSKVLYEGVLDTDETFFGDRYLRPAFVADSGDIVLASAAVGGKVDDSGDSRLTEVSTTTPTEWKLTLHDSARSLQVESTSRLGNVLTLQYSFNFYIDITLRGHDEYISAIVHDGKSNEITHYGRLLSNPSESGTLTVQLPGDMTDKTLFVFYEQCNGDKKSDYASTLNTVDTDPDTYALAADVTSLSFGRAYAGGIWPAAQTVTITNIGNRSATLPLPTLAGYTIAAGAGFNGSAATLAAGGSAAFTVRPNAGLEAGAHNKTLAIAGSHGESAQVSVEFVVSAPSAAIQLGTGGAGNPYGGVSPSAYSRVYFGVDGAAPIRWRVLNKDKTNTGADGMFLLTEGFLPAAAQAFDEGGDVEYNISSIRKILQTNDNSMLNTAFSGLEREAMLATTKTDGDWEIAGRIFYCCANILNADKLFLLSLQETETRDYFPHPGTDHAASNGGGFQKWWLRSTAQDDRYGVPIVKGYIDQNGNLSIDNPRASYFIRPAFNLDSSKVLFTSCEGGKAAPGMENGLTAVGKNAADDWKWTLLDSGRDGFSAEALERNGNTLRVAYAGATVYDPVLAPHEYISALVKDASGAVIRYGRVGRPDAASGTVDIDLAALCLAKTDTLCLFSEQYNGEQRTDYASPLRSVAIPAPASLVTITAQPADQTLTEGRQPAFALTATGEGLRYQWYVDRLDGRGWQTLNGANTARYAGEPAALDQNGFRYYCQVTDLYEQTADSAIATLRVAKAVVLPPTGDGASPLWWLCLCLMGLAGALALIGPKPARCKRTRTAQPPR